MQVGIHQGTLPTPTVHLACYRDNSEDRVKTTTSPYLTDVGDLNAPI